MPQKIRPLLAGNWKMNGTAADLGEVRRMAEASVDGLDLLVCMPATLVARACAVAEGSALRVGGQDCHAEASGAHTGDVSAEMLAEAGASHVIVGHSERRTNHGETDADVAAKAQAAWRAGLTAIICIGETRQQRESGETLDVLARQIEGSVPAASSPENCVVAYEPVWAIGTGLTPSEADVAAAHAHIRTRLRDRLGQAADGIRLLYGGSVKPDNAGSLMAVDDVDGALVGGASLKAADFLAIAGAFPAD